MTDYSGALQGALAVPSTVPLTFNYSQASNASGSDGKTTLRYFGVLGGVVWSKAEAFAWLRFPEQVWAPARPFQQLVRTRRRPFLTVVHA